MIHTFNVSLLYFIFDLQLNWLLSIVLLLPMLAAQFCFYKAFEGFFIDH